MPALAIPTSLPDAPPTPASTCFEAAAPTILVVEDDPVLCEVLCRILCRDGYCVRRALGASQALELIDERSPQLVMLDSCLREGTSLQLAQAIHRRDDRLPVILLTNSGFKNEDFPRWTAGRFLNKSLGLADLRWAVAAALNEAKSPGPPQPPAAAHAPAITTKSPSFPPRPVANGSALRIVKDFSMRLFESKSAKVVGALLLGVVLVVGLVAANGAMRPSAAADDAMPAAKEPGTGDKSTDSVDLVEGKPHTLFVPVDVRKALGIRKNSVDLIAVAQRPTRMRPLVMPGSTALDPTRIFRLRARFAPSPSSAECVEIGQIAEDPRRSGKTQTVFREIHSGDRVIKGNLLAVFYSVDVGNKKNDLVDAIYQLKLDDRVMKRWESKVSIVPDIMLWNQERTVVGDINAIERAVSTLRAWGIPEEDIQALRKEAESVKPEDAQKRLRLHDRSNFERWARVEIKAPADGIVIQRDLTLHEFVVDNTLNLFQIADLTKLFVTANCPEDDLPLLEGLQESSHGLIPWTVKTVGSPPMSGYIDDISYLIDPNQHTAVVKGYIENKQARLRGGQFISATVELPPPEDVVEIPISAMIEDGQDTVVFVETDAVKQQYTMRRVGLTNRFQDTVFVRSKPFAKEEQLTPEEAERGLLPKEPLRPGERVLQTGVGELKLALLSRELAPRSKPTKGEAK
jgi:cobalt-zinc-cadmium efflux system membrane fusion protein